MRILCGILQYQAICFDRSGEINLEFLYPLVYYHIILVSHIPFLMKPLYQFVHNPTYYFQEVFTCFNFQDHKTAEKIFYFAESKLPGTEDFAVFFSFAFRKFFKSLKLLLCQILRAIAIEVTLKIVYCKFTSGIGMRLKGILLLSQKFLKNLM